jgi:7,8-dihydropterin-6-yl-methyl-4-(beta-D-ribofuranosyl)aminobenzene 5'-phosphate synthase
MAAGDGLRRRDLLCGGGAAALAAVVSSLIGESKAAVAEAVAGPVPEVDRVAVRVVIDSYQIAIAPNASTENVEVQRSVGR